jgi:hypothetical protein
MYAIVFLKEIYYHDERAFGHSAPRVIGRDELAPKSDRLLSEETAPTEKIQNRKLSKSQKSKSRLRSIANLQLCLRSVKATRPYERPRRKSFQGLSPRKARGAALPKVILLLFICQQSLDG